MPRSDACYGVSVWPDGGDSSSSVRLADSAPNMTTLATAIARSPANGSSASVWLPVLSSNSPMTRGAVLDPTREAPAAQPAAVPRRFVGYELASPGQRDRPGRQRTH